MKLHNKLHDIGFRAKFTAILIVIVFAAVSITGYFSINNMRDNLEQEAKEKQELLAWAFEAQVEQFLFDAQGIIASAAQLPAVRDVSMVPEIREDIKGVPRDVAVDKRYLMQQIVDKYGYFGYMEQITAPGAGNNIVLEPWEYQLDLKQLDFGHRDWAQSAIAKDDTHISEVYISSSLQEPVIAISHPVKDENGQLTSVLMGALTLDRLSEFSQQLNYGDTGQAYLIDQNGVLAAHRNPEFVAEIKDVTNIPMVQKAMQGETGNGIFQDPLTNTEVYAQYMPVADTGWSLVVQQSVDEMYAPVQAAVTRTIIVCVILIVIAIALAIWTANSTVRPINKLAAAAGLVAKGDLTQKIDVNSKDEVGMLASAFNEMIKNLRNMTLTLRDEASNLASFAQQLSANAEETSAGATETASTITEVASTVEQAAQNALSIRENAELTTAEAEKGRDGIQKVTGQMESISNSTQNVAKAINSLDTMSGEIGMIVETITDIAGQTNLLALNAAIEAARAGEQGRGFAVVAEEVRKLAEQSESAAREIQQLISNVQSESKQASEAMYQGADEVQKGVEIVEEARQVFAGIIDRVGGLAEQVDGIASSTEQISGAVQNVASTTEEMTAAMEEMASSTETLNSMAEQLQNMAAKFKVEEDTFTSSTALNEQTTESKQEPIEIQHKTD